MRKPNKDWKAYNQLTGEQSSMAAEARSFGNLVPKNVHEPFYFTEEEGLDWLILAWGSDRIYHVHFYTRSSLPGQNTAHVSVHAVVDMHCLIDLTARCLLRRFLG